jgi:tetratricopeptide (TPR) repeat protein
MAFDRENETPEGTRSNTLWIIAAVLIMGLAGGLVLGGKRLLTKYQNYKADEIVARVDADLDAERFEAAANQVRSALAEYPNNPGLLRVAARLIDEAFSDFENAAAMLRKVIAMGAGTPADNVRLGMMLVRAGQADQALETHKELADEVKQSADAMELLALIYRETGRGEEGFDLLREALKKEPDNPRAQLRLATMDLEVNGLDTARGKIAETIWKLAERSDRVGLDAIGYLNTMPELTATQVRVLRKLVEAHPQMSGRVRYAVLSSYMRLIPLERDALLKQEVEANKDKPIAGQFDFLRWLGGQKEHDRILQSLPRQLATKDPDIFRVYVDALASAGRWTEIISMMKEKVPVAKTTATFILARANAELPSEQKQTRQHLKGLFASAGPVDSELVLQAASIAEEKGHADIAVEGYKKVIEVRPRLKVTLLERVMELQHRVKNVEGIIEALKALRQARPSNPDYPAQLAYYRLLTGTELELAWTTPAKDSKRVPLALLKVLTGISQNQPSVNVQDLKNLPNVDQMDAGVRAVIAGLWAMAKDEVKAYRLAEAVPPGLLLPQEANYRRAAFGP